MQTDYRMIIKSALNRRRENGEPHSSRAFATKLGVSVSFLSEVMNSKKSLSVELALKIAVKLAMTDLETQRFCLLVQLEREKDPVFREELQRRLNELNPRQKVFDLSADLFKSISDWHHAAILELSYFPAFKLNADSSARRLGISKLEAELALERLLRLELLEKDRKGTYRKTHGYVYSQSHVPNAAFKAFHSGILEKAQAALVTQTPVERVSATDILAIDSRRLEQVDRLSQEFSAAVIKLGEKSKVKNAVYALSTHFFRLTKEETRS